jgi:hypothetical protein
MSRTPIKVWASSIGDLLDCPARFEARQIKHLRCPRRGNAQLGTALHASTAVFDNSLIKGDGLKSDDCAGALVDAIYKPEEDVIWDEDMGQQEAESIGRALHGRYCTEIAPTQGYVAVEVKCERLEISDLGLILSGKTDRIRKIGDGHGIADLKSGKTAVRADGTVETAGAAAQLGVYELLAENATGIAITEPARIVGLQVAKTARGQRVGTGEVAMARDLLVGTPDSPGVLEYASKLIHEGLFYGNPRSTTCHSKYCPVFEVCRWRK